MPWREPFTLSLRVSTRMVKKSVRLHNKILQEVPEEECQFLSASVLREMPTRSDPLAPDHDCYDVIQLQG